MTRHWRYDKATTALLFCRSLCERFSFRKLMEKSGRVSKEGGNRGRTTRQSEGIISRAVRRAGIRIFIVPHRRWEPGDYETWHHPSPTQLAIMKRHSFARGEWGGDWHPDFAPQDGYSDIIIKEHWSSPSGFANTDLDLQLKATARHQSRHFRGAARQYMYRDDRALCAGAWIPCHAGSRRATAAFTRG